MICHQPLNLRQVIASCYANLLPSDLIRLNEGQMGIAKLLSSNYSKASVA